MFIDLEKRKKNAWMPVYAPHLLFHYFCCTHLGKTHLTSVKLICTVQPRWPFGKLGRWRCSKPWMKGPGTEMKDRGIRILTQEIADFLTKTTLWHDPWWKTVVFTYILQSYHISCLCCFAGHIPLPKWYSLLNAQWNLVNGGKAPWELQTLWLQKIPPANMNTSLLSQ